MTDLTSLARVKNWLNITDSNSDTNLTPLISAASHYVTTFLSREVALQAFSERCSGNGKKRLRLGEWPIATITTLKVDGVTVPASPDKLKGGYAFDDKFIYLLDGSAVPVFQFGFQNIEVSYTAGYAVIPPEIEQVVVEIVGKRYKDRSRIGLISEGIAGQATSFSQRDMTEDSRMVLNNYRRVFTT